MWLRESQIIGIRGWQKHNQNFNVSVKDERMETRFY